VGKERKKRWYDDPPFLQYDMSRKKSRVREKKKKRGGGGPRSNSFLYYICP